MVIAKSDSFTCELPKRGSCFLADKIRAHSVPHHDDDMPLSKLGVSAASEMTRKEKTSTRIDIDVQYFGSMLSGRLRSGRASQSRIHSPALV